MRSSTRIRPTLTRTLTALCTASFGLCAMLSCLYPTPAQAGSGIAITMENLFVPMGKQVEKVYDGNTQISASISPQPAGTTTSKDAQGKEISLPPAGSSSILLGRQTTEWIGLSGFWDLNRNWRLLGGAHTTLIGGRPLFKLDGSLAFMLPVPDIIPLQPYVFLGAVPVFSTTDPAVVPSFGFNLQSGLGVDFVWNNKLYATARLNLYMLSLYGEDTKKEFNLYWQPASFSFTAGMGFLF